MIVIQLNGEKNEYAGDMPGLLGGLFLPAVNRINHVKLA